MKVLTLTQPWATLVAIAAKRIETRSWATSYRGPLAIHAAAGLSGMAKGGLVALGATEPQCQHEAGQAWLARQQDLLLPAPYFIRRTIFLWSPSPCPRNCASWPVVISK